MSYSLALRASLILILSFVALAANGCGGGSATPATSPTPCLYDTFAIPALQLIYPIPGSTSVPTNIGILIYAGESEPIELELPNSTLVPTDGATAVPSPLPSPAATPFGTEQLFAVKVGALASNTLYTAQWSEPVPDPCNGTVPLETFPIGSFTTQ